MPVLPLSNGRFLAIWSEAVNYVAPIGNNPYFEDKAPGSKKIPNVGWYVFDIKANHSGSVVMVHRAMRVR